MNTKNEDELKQNNICKNKNDVKFYSNVNEKITALAKIKMRYFLRKAFEIINPSVKLCWNWHLNYLCDILEEVYKGNIKRLIINIPPRYLKSIICSVSFPAWILGQNPTKRIIVASYSKILATKHSTDARQIMMSKWYRNTFPKTIIANGMNEKNKFCTTKNGFRFATSVNGTLTGEGGDYLIIDDPHNPVNIFNASSRKKIINWFSGVFSSRLNNKKNGAIIVVMQRLHIDDLSGYLLSKNDCGKKNKWFLVCLPAIAEEKQTYFLYDKIYKIRQVGDILHQKMEPKDVLMTIKKDLGEYNFVAQYQQNPVSLEGNIIKKEWIKYFNLADYKSMDDKKLHYYISIDCASGIGTENDFSAIAIFFISDCKFYLCKMKRLKLQYPVLKQVVQEEIIKYNPVAILIEDKSNGSSLIQDLKVNYNNIIAIKPTKSKEYRVNDILTTFEAGNIYIAKNEDWTQEFEIELLSFPSCKHDDQVDSVSQFINWFNKNRNVSIVAPKIRRM